MIVKHINIVPETSSSSRHAISIGNHTARLSRKKKFVITFQEYGHNGDIVQGEELFSYFAVQADLKGVLRSYLYHLEDLLGKEIDVKYDTMAWIDHQSIWNLRGPDVGEFLADFAYYLYRKGGKIHLIWDGEFYDDLRGIEFDEWINKFFPEEGIVFKNGNYYVFISTWHQYFKLRIQFNDEPLKPEFPETIDVKLTDKCNYGCPFCSEGSSPHGKHGERFPKVDYENYKWAEWVLGGGNPLEAPLLPIGMSLPNKAITVKGPDFKRVARAGFQAVGVSLDPMVPIKRQVEEVKKHSTFRSNLVFHVINRVHTTKQVLTLMEEAMFDHILILGFKDPHPNRSGFNPVRPLDLERILEKADEMSISLAFDTLAVKQLEVLRYIEPDLVPYLWGGDDGEFSIFVDCVTGEVWDSSRRELGPWSFEEMNLRTIFGEIRREKGFE